MNLLTTNPEHPPLAPALARLEAVRKGVAARKSFRQIARELNCDEKTIRRDYAKLRLPADKQQLILGGAACEPILLQQQQIAQAEECRRAALEAAQNRQRLLDEERRSEYLSITLRDSIIAFLAMFDLLPVDKLSVIRPVETRCWHTGDLPQTALMGNYEKAIALTVPGKLPEETTLLINSVTVWLYRWLIRAEPLRDIRDRGITKARQYFESLSRM